MIGKTHAGRLVVAALLAAGIVAAWRWRGLFDPLALTGLIGGNPTAPLVFLAVHIAGSLFFVPRTVLALGAGLVFGMWWGILWAALGSVAGAVAGFLAARYVRSGFVDLAAACRGSAALLEARRARRLAHGRRAAADAGHPAQPDQLCAGADQIAARRLRRRLAARPIAADHRLCRFRRRRRTGPARGGGLAPRHAVAEPHRACRARPVAADPGRGAPRLRQTRSMPGTSAGLRTAGRPIEQLGGMHDRQRRVARRAG